MSSITSIKSIYSKKKKSPEEIFKEKFDKYIDFLKDGFRREYEIPNDYKIISEDIFFNAYFTLVNNNIQMIFKNPSEAAIVGKLLLASSLAKSISYFKIVQIVITDGTAFILEPIYDNKKELTCLEENKDMFIKANEFSIIELAKEKINNGTIVIDDLFLK